MSSSSEESTDEEEDEPKKFVPKDTSKCIQQPLMKYFQQKRRRGRPKKISTLSNETVTVKKRGRGRPKGSTKYTTLEAVERAKKKKPLPLRKSQPSPKADPPAPKPKQKRTNWGKGEARKKMEAAIEDWLQKKGKALDSNGEATIPLMQFCVRVQIPYIT